MPEFRTSLKERPYTRKHRMTWLKNCTIFWMPERTLSEDAAGPHRNTFENSAESLRLTGNNNAATTLRFHLYPGRHGRCKYRTPVPGQSCIMAHGRERGDDFFFRGGQVRACSCRNRYQDMGKNRRQRVRCGERIHYQDTGLSLRIRTRA